jgi:hypothetical protein
LCNAGKKKEGVRGPTEMKKFWEKHGPDNKVELVFNHLGQPCGVKTSKLANFIGSCVKGKEVSMGHDEWRKVPESEKDRLWTVVKGFFNIGDEHKDWVMKSASKKMEDLQGSLLRLKRIYNFLCSMLLLLQYLNVLYILYSIIIHFPALTY